jgi:predicted small lipoprotein YifL
MRIALVALALALSACGGSGYNPLPPDQTPLPPDGPIAYRCSDGTQLMVDLQDNQARVAIIGGPSMVLPNAGAAYYSNGRYGFRGGGRNAQWEVGRAAPLQCQGG